jgi:HEAT repeat protein
MSDILDKLKGTDRRSIGKAEVIVREVLDDPDLFDELFKGMLHDDPVVRMRAADAVEKITRERPHLLQSHKKKLFDDVAVIDQQEIRWHVAQMFPRLTLTEPEQNHFVEILFGYLNNKSKIVVTNAMQALADLAENDDQLRLKVIEVIKNMIETGSAAVKSRGRKLLKKLSRE